MKREVKIGIFAVAMIGAAWAGIRFLKGFDIFSRNSVYYAAYDQINGVQNASPIMMKGVKIGSVTGLEFDPARSDKVVLRFTIKRDYPIPSDSEAKIFSNGLMGAKAIEITYGKATTFLEPGDTLRSSRDRDLMDVAGSELDFFKQKFSQVTADLSRTLDNLNRLMETNESSITGTLRHLNSLTGDMASVLDAEKQNLRAAIGSLTEFSEMLGANSGRVESIIGNLDEVSSQLSEEQVARKIAEAVGNLNDLLARIEQGDGTLGKLLGDPALYNSLDRATANLAALLADVKEYPGRYVHFSLFGRDPEKMKERADRRAAKAAEKAERDSLRQLRNAEE
ncbi:MlaD family protein [Alistipes sp.]|uniref:MlaD family protein n=1 Tax=Alistipes sp. TaxID=1872444 RepID=UPI003AEF79E9